MSEASEKYTMECVVVEKAPSRSEDFASGSGWCDVYTLIPASLMTGSNQNRP